MLDESGIEPLVKTEQCDAEKLVERFGCASFDIAHAKNCLDHCYDPVVAICEMVWVIRPGGLIYLGHNYNEGDRQKYHGLHRWNFCNDGDRFIVWRGDHRVGVFDEIAEPIETRIKNVDDRWLSVWITRKQ